LHQQNLNWAVLQHMQTDDPAGHNKNKGK